MITLHEGFGISAPERYTLPGEDNKPQDTFFESKTVKPTVGVPLDVSDLHNSQGDGHSREVGTFKRGSGVYALLECEKSQVLLYTSSATVDNPLWTAHGCRFDVSQSMDFSVHVYVGNPLSTPGFGRTQDILLGVARSNHGFKNSQSSAQDLDKAESTIVRTTQGNKDTVSYTGWLDVEHGAGKIYVSVEVRKWDSGRLYALKEIRNLATASQAQDADTVETIKLRALSLANNPFIVPIKFVFQSAENLYQYIHSWRQFDPTTL